MPRPRLQFKEVNGKIYNLNLCAGGKLHATSNPKHKRPLTIKYAMHLVLRSSKAKGSARFYYGDNFEKIENILRQQSKKHQVKIYRYANVHNHLHLIIRPKSRQAYTKFIKSITGLIARAVTKSQKNKSMSHKGFWDHRPFTRVLESWGNQYRTLIRYLNKNWLEAFGEVFDEFDQMGYFLRP